jgi:two-component system sensor histidine kinase TctE
MNKAQSLRTKLLARLTLPLVLVVLVDASASYFVALHYADLAYDRWLLDSAKSLAQEVKTKQDHVSFELPPIAVEVFRWDDVDKTFFKVESEADGFLAGDEKLPSPVMANLMTDEPWFWDGEIDGQNVRIVSVLSKQAPQAEHVVISVAETLNKRRSMMHEILLADVVPQLLLVFIACFYIWAGVGKGLKPLNQLAKVIAKRSAKDFKPISDVGVPLEVLVLTHTINELLQRLGATLIAQQRFIENAAHQLRTPLAGLKVQAERALAHDDPQAMKLALTQIKNSADRVAHLSTQLLTLAKSESASQTLPDFKLIDLTALVRQTCIDWVPIALERNIDLGFETSKPLIEVRGDEVLLRELLSNLLDNAICYGKSGGHISVKIHGYTHFSLSVEDDGPGIAVDEQEKIFERFYRIQGSPGEGCGLGLAIVKEIADLHSATIKIEQVSTLNGGLRILLDFGAG